MLVPNIDNIINELDYNLNDLPLVIAGPILRKVTPTEVSVWFALKEEKRIHLEIKSLANNSRQGLAYAETISIGQHIHIALVTLKAADFLNGYLYSNTKYSYNAYFSDIDPAGVNPGSPQITNTFPSFWSNGIIYPFSSSGGDPGSDIENKLTYPGESYPTFFVPSNEVDGLTVAHASCRKPHGGRNNSKNKDALDTLDDTILKFRENSPPNVFDVDLFNPTQVNEPQILFLTGDQIYADDVHPRLLYMIRNAVNSIYSPNFLEGVEAPYIFENDDVDNNAFNVNKRAKLVYRKGDFTSGHPDSDYGHNQLIHASEFFLMYLFSWSDVLWPTENVIKKINNTNARLVNYDISNHSDIDEKHLENLLSFRRTLPKVRRLLANISSYMMFDDHDVTDDFFINYNWTNKVLNSDLGKYITGNGLMAFGLFQSWGNNPDYYKDVIGRSFISNVVAWHDTFIGASVSNTNIDLANPSQELSDIYIIILPSLQRNDGAYGSNVEGYELVSTIKWHVDIDFGEYHAVIMDPRTKRWFKKTRDTPYKGLGYYQREPAGLLSEKAIIEQIPASTTSKVTILISPAPVFGLKVIEDIQYISIYLTNFINFFSLDNDENAYTSKDAEAWSFNEYAWDSLIKRLVAHENVIILSGDVHYGFTTDTKIFDYSDPDDINQTNTTVNSKVKPANGKLLRIMQCTASSAKNEVSGLTGGSLAANGSKWVASNEDIMVLADKRDDKYKQGTLSVERDFKERITFADNKHMNELKSYIKYKTYPTRIYKTKYIKDERAWTLRGDGAGSQDAQRWAPGHNNIGIVNFDWNDDKKIVNHTILFRVGPGLFNLYFDPIFSTKHSVDFEEEAINPYQP